MEGAGWTCYSLWHWTHGETKQIIRNLTGDLYSPADLQNLLQTTEYQAFAIEQFTRRQDFSEKTVDLIQKAIEKDLMLIALNIAYLNSAPTSIFEQRILTKNEISKPPNSMQCLKATLNFLIARRVYWVLSDAALSSD